MKYYRPLKHTKLRFRKISRDICVVHTVPVIRTLQEYTCDPSLLTELDGQRCCVEFMQVSDLHLIYSENTVNVSLMFTLDLSAPAYNTRVVTGFLCRYLVTEFAESH